MAAEIAISRAVKKCILDFAVRNYGKTAQEARLSECEKSSKIIFFSNFERDTKVKQGTPFEHWLVAMR